MNMTLWITLFTYVLIYITFTYSQKLSPLHCYFGVYMPDTFAKSSEGKSIFKSFLIHSTFAFFVTLTISCILIFTNHFTSGLLILFILVQLILYFAFYIVAHKKVRTFKMTLSSPQNISAKFVIDTDFVAQKIHLRNRYFYLYLVPLMINILTGIYLFDNYKHLPELIPTHWNYLGQADHWSTKSIWSVASIVLFQLLFTVLMAFCSRSQWNARSKGNQNSEAFKNGHLKYLKVVSLSFYILTLFFVSFMVFNAYALVTGTNLNVFVTLLMSVFPFACIIWLLYAYFKYERPSLHATKDSTQYLPEDNDQYWLLGSLYHNPNDPALFVEKRYGLGWTMNIGTPLGKLIAIITLIVLIITLGTAIFTSVPL